MTPPIRPEGPWDDTATDSPRGQLTVATPHRWGRSACESDEPFDGFPPDLTDVQEQLRHTAPQAPAVLLIGETGTGRTRLARLLHELSPRRHGPFLAVHCGALSPERTDHELFGTDRACTGTGPGKLAAARRGTLLLDEIDALPTALQGKLLRALEGLVPGADADVTCPVRGGVIAVSGTALQRGVATGSFLPALGALLAGTSFTLPPLRFRRAVVRPLTEKFLAEFATRHRPDVWGIADDAVHALEQYDWPGNVRQLRNVVERAVALCSGAVVQVADLPEAVRPV